jgi:hypothetical protein
MTMFRLVTTVGSFVHGEMDESSFLLELNFIVALGGSELDHARILRCLGCC